MGRGHPEVGRGHPGTCPSVAAAGFHHHVPVLLEDDVVVAVVVEDRGGTELGGGTARLGHGLGLHQVDLGDGWSPVSASKVGSKAAAKAPNRPKTPGEWGDYFHLFAKIFVLNSRRSLLRFVLDQGSRHRVKFGISGPFSHRNGQTTKKTP